MTIDLAIVGAGSAGLSAAKIARMRGLSYIVLEASHRIGGRAYSEEVAPGVWFDLGCHWLHSASLNPYVEVADAFGFTYLKEESKTNLFLTDRVASAQEHQEYHDFYRSSEQAVHQAVAAGRDVSVADVTERHSFWTPLFDYWTSVLTSADSDQVSAVDYASYHYTGENWPVKQGFGALIAHFGADVPVKLNCAVNEIDWAGQDIRLITRNGVVSAKKAIITVSTGILGAGDIKFTPSLPVWKQEAISALPLGDYNQICLVYDRNVFGSEHRSTITVMEAEDVPMQFRIRPFGYDYVVAHTGGRFSAWLERAGIEASADLAKQKLVKALGSTITQHIVRHNVTAWHGDPWIKGAYSAAVPGQGHQRVELARPVDDRLFFAGEATSTEFFSTAHGAYLTGASAANRVADILA